MNASVRLKIVPIIVRFSRGMGGGLAIGCCGWTLSLTPRYQATEPSASVEYA